MMESEFHSRHDRKASATDSRAEAPLSSRSAAPISTKLLSQAAAADNSPRVQRLKMHQGALNRTSSSPDGPPLQAMFASQVAQLVREVNPKEEQTLSAIWDTMDHFDDVLTHSSSIPPRLPVEFFALYDETHEELHGIHETHQVEDDSSIGILEENTQKLSLMMNAAKDRAAIDRTAIEPGDFRPNRPPENARTIAMDKAQGTNTGIKSQHTLQENIEFLRSKKGARFFVFGQSAMGQGDTAFIVRTVNLLRSYGLEAIGVKGESQAHSPGTSFNMSLPFITPQEMIQGAKPDDFVIEGPLSDPIFTKTKPVKSILEKIKADMGSDADKLEGVHNLRLYEYGTLNYRGGQYIQSVREGGPQTPTSKANIVNYADDPHHAFMGMGYGEMGAFYNSRGDAPSGGRPGAVKILKEHASDNLTCAELLPHIAGNADIYIGYANGHASVLGWASAVSQAAGKSGKHTVVLGLYGGTKVLGKFAIPGTTSVGFNERAKNDGNVPKGELSRSAPETPSNCIVIISNSIPSPVMAALQGIAQPFTLSTGNYSLSEAIENGHFPIYETLAFNAGVDTALRVQITHALESLKLTDTEFGHAVQALTGATPDTLGKKKCIDDLISIIVQHPYDVKMLMSVIKVNTDISKGLIARLANIAGLQ